MAVPTFALAKHNFDNTTVRQNVMPNQSNAIEVGFTNGDHQPAENLDQALQFVHVTPSLVSELILRQAQDIIGQISLYKIFQH
jgi:hypothetical protein